MSLNTIQIIPIYDVHICGNWRTHSGRRNVLPPPPPDVDSVVSTEFLRGAEKDVRNLEVPEVTGDVCSPPQGCYPTS